MEKISPTVGIVFAVVAFIVLWLVLGRGEQLVPTTPPETSLDPDFYMSGVDSIQYDETGQPRYQLFANQMSHFPHNDITEITLPHIIIYNKNGSPWRLSSLYGQILPAGDSVELWEEVEVNYEPPDDNYLKLSTDSLRIFPRKEYAETYQAVMIESPRGTTSARGLQADLQTNRLRLLAKVRGQYEGNL